MNNGLGCFIKEARESLNLSLRDASSKIGISPSYLSNLEKGRDPRTGMSQKPSPETLRLISDAYGASYDLLLQLCGYLEEDSMVDERISNPDIRLIARAGKKLTVEQAGNLRKYAEFMFPEAFK